MMHLVTYLEELYAVNWGLDTQIVVCCWVNMSCGGWQDYLTANVVSVMKASNLTVIYGKLLSITQAILPVNYGLNFKFAHSCVFCLRIQGILTCKQAPCNH